MIMFTLEPASSFSGKMLFENSHYIVIGADNSAESVANKGLLTPDQSYRFLKKFGNTYVEGENIVGFDKGKIRAARG